MENRDTITTLLLDSWKMLLLEDVFIHSGAGGQNVEDAQLSWRRNKQINQSETKEKALKQSTLIHPGTSLVCLWLDFLLHGSHRILYFSLFVCLYYTDRLLYDIKSD